jgi:hypothetical protein
VNAHNLTDFRGPVGIFLMEVSVFDSVAEPEPHHLVGARAVTQCGWAPTPTMVLFMAGNLK